MNFNLRRWPDREDTLKMTSIRSIPLRVCFFFHWAFSNWMCFIICLWGLGTLWLAQKLAILAYPGSQSTFRFLRHSPALSLHLVFCHTLFSATFCFPPCRIQNQLFIKILIKLRENFKDPFDFIFEFICPRKVSNFDLNLLN